MGMHLSTPIIAYCVKVQEDDTLEGDGCVLKIDGVAEITEEHYLCKRIFKDPLEFHRFVANKDVYSKTKSSFITYLRSLGINTIPEWKIISSYG